MAEIIRSIAATIEIDTNKKTITRTISADSFKDLKDEVRMTIEELQEELG